MENKAKIRNPQKYTKAKIAQIYHSKKKSIYALKSSDILPIFNYKQLGMTLKDVKNKLNSYRPLRKSYNPQYKEIKQDILLWQDHCQRWLYYLRTQSVLVRKNTKIYAEESQLLRTCDRFGISKYYLYEYWEDVDWDYYAKCYKYPKVWKHRKLHILGLESLEYLKLFNPCESKLGVGAFLRFSVCKYDLKTVSQIKKVIREHEKGVDEKIIASQNRLERYVNNRGYYTRFDFMDVG